MVCLDGLATYRDSNTVSRYDLLIPYYCVMGGNFDKTKLSKICHAFCAS